MIMKTITAGPVPGLGRVRLEVEPLGASRDRLLVITDRYRWMAERPADPVATADWLTAVPAVEWVSLFAPGSYRAVVYLEPLREKLRTLVWGRRRKGMSGKTAGALIEEINGLQETDPREAMRLVWESPLMDEIGAAAVDALVENVGLHPEAARLELIHRVLQDALRG